MRRMKHVSVVAFCALALVVGVLPAVQGAPQAHADPVAQAAPVRVMALGDALATGTGSSTSTDRMGYRAPLQRALTAAGIAYDMVGSISSGNAAKYDVQNEGHAGYRLDQLTAKANSWLTQNPADVVLLTAGLQDVTANYKLSEAPSRFETLLTTIRNAAPNAQILVSTLIDSTNATYQSRITAYNAAVRDIVARQAANVAMVDLSGLMAAGKDYSSNVNPNDTGYNKISVAWCQALATVLPDASGLATPPIKIMPLGDSITYGLGSSSSNDDASYRGFLQRYLDAAGISYDMIGSQRRGIQDRIDTDNEGHSGWRIDQVVAQVPTWFSAAKPDVVLLYIGMNDMNQNYQLTTAPTRLSSLIDLVRANAPGVKIVVGTIFESKDTALQTRISAYDVSVRQVVANQAAEHSDVWLAEMGGLFNPATDLADRLHPNASGYFKMAGVWASVLTEILPGGSDLTPQTTIMPFGGTTVVGTSATSALGNMGFRGLLYRSLANARHNVDMVGSGAHGEIDYADTGDEGHASYRVDQLTTNVPTWMKNSGTPDIILVYAGETDVTGNYQLSTFQNRFASLIAALRSNAPNATILVGTLVDTTNKTYSPRIGPVNDAIRAVVAQSDSGVVLVDFSSIASATDVSGMNPTDSGYTKMAAMWSAAVEPFLTAH